MTWRLFMNLDDLIAEALTDNDEALYEDDYMRVTKIIREIPTGSKDYVKRLQLVIWKKKNSDVPDFDIRGFSYRNNRYQRGITLNHLEMKELFEALSKYFEEQN